MLPRRRYVTYHLLAALLSALAVLASAASAAWAAPKDKAAEKLYSQAMDEDYLNTNFDPAIKKLNSAIKTCGTDGCSKEVLGKIYVALGVVYGGGKNDMGQAKANFAKAFEIDPKAKPLEDFMTSDLKKAFDEAKKGGGTTPKPTPAPTPKGDDDDDDAAGDVAWDAPKEAAVNTPLPIFIKVPDDIGAAKVSLRYKPFGSAKELKIELRRKADGWGGMIPCKELSTTGALQVRILMSDEGGDMIASAGTKRKPYTIQIKNKLDGPQPSLPGEKPPQKCATAADCPPDFPGCGAKPGDDDDDGERGDKGWGATCEETKECRKGFICLNGSCEEGTGDDDDDDDDGGEDVAMNYFFLGGGPDLMVINSAENVCGTLDGGTAWNSGFKQEHDNYFCFNRDGEFLGKPIEGKFNQVQGGLGVSSGRIYIGYNRVIWEGLEAGIRIGAAFPGSPSVGDAEDRFEDCQARVEGDGDDTTNPDDCREPAANNFLPFHAEARIGWLFLRTGLVRPFAFVGGGLAQVNAGVNVAVCDAAADDGGPLEAGDVDDNCDNVAAKRDIEAFQVTGLNFVGVGGGTILAFHKHFGMFIEAKVMFMLPTFGVVIAPSIGPVGMF